MRRRRRARSRSAGGHRLALSTCNGQRCSGRRGRALARSSGRGRCIPATKATHRTGFGRDSLYGLRAESAPQATSRRGSDKRSAVGSGRGDVVFRPGQSLKSVAQPAWAGGRVTMSLVARTASVLPNAAAARLMCTSPLPALGDSLGDACSCSRSASSRWPSGLSRRCKTLRDAIRLVSTRSRWTASCRSCCRDPPALRAGPVLLHLPLDAVAVRRAPPRGDRGRPRSLHPPSRVRAVPGVQALQALRRASAIGSLRAGPHVTADDDPFQRGLSIDTPRAASACTTAVRSSISGRSFPSAFRSARRQADADRDLRVAGRARRRGRSRPFTRRSETPSTTGNSSAPTPRSRGRSWRTCASRSACVGCHSTRPSATPCVGSIFEPAADSPKSSRPASRGGGRLRCSSRSSTKIAEVATDTGVFWRRLIERFELDLKRGDALRDTVARGRRWQ